MRITGGKSKGIPIRVPAGTAFRPATDRMREAVFSSLGARTEGARFFDLYAGSGSYGLEAISRGATEGMFVEKHPKLQAVIRQNLEAVCRSAGCRTHAYRILRQNLPRWPDLPPWKADLVFVDPPYDIIEENAPALFDLFDKLLTHGGCVVFEMPGRLEILPPEWSCLKRLGRGRNDPVVCLLQRRID